MKRLITELADESKKVTKANTLFIYQEDNSITAYFEGEKIFSLKKQTAIEVSQAIIKKVK